MRSIAVLAALFSAGLAASPAAAAPYYWADWTGTQSNVSTGGVTVFGTITTPTTTLNITYESPAGGVSFVQTATGSTDYWTNLSGVRNNAASPYTSALVDNIPTGTDIVALNQAGLQTLTFSESIANPVFSFVSLNGNGYGFDQDFDLLSFGDGSVAHPHCGYWGCGNSYKEVVGPGDYRLLSEGGEPHGTLRFRGTFSTLTWQSLSPENWNGFTVGIQGTAAEVPTSTPEPASLALLGVALAGLAATRRRR